jgi:hypothetical protein
MGQEWAICRCIKNHATVLDTARHLDTRCRDFCPLLSRSLIQSLREVHLRIFPFLGLFHWLMLSNPLLEFFNAVDTQDLLN